MATVTLTATYTTAGTFTWTCPAGVTSVTVACTGGGGGAGACTSTSGSQGGGGGAGEAALEPALGVTPGLPYQGSVGAAGAGGTPSTLSQAGGITTFAGDTVTVTAHGGGRGTGGNATGAGQPGAGGLGSTNTVSAAGGAAAAGSPATYGGGGGGGAGVSTTTGFPGNAGSGSTAGAGSGGTWAGGAGGAGAASAGAGSNATAPGGGGGGALSTGTAANGGNGAAGQVVITWTMTDPLTLSTDTTGGVWQYTVPAGVTSINAQAWGSGAGGYNVPGGAGGLIGSTTIPTGYGVTTYTAAASVFDGYISRPMALKAQAKFLSEGQYPTSSSSPLPLDQMATMGDRVAIVFRPLRTGVTLSTGAAVGGVFASESTNITNAITLINGVLGSTGWYACLWNEMNGNTWSPNTAADYITYHQAYAPVFHTAGAKIAWKPTVDTSNNDPTLYYPGTGSTGVDYVIPDFYCPAYDRGNDLTATSAKADADGLPFGLGEWGYSASSASPTHAQWTAFTNYIVSFFQGRTTAGKSNWDIIYWTGQTVGGTNNVTGPSDFKVPGLQNVYDSLSTTTAVGGAGGGGGEYAAEAALAVTETHSYTIAVGNGGADQMSGQSTTIAGQSVTVTAHGGSVATSQAAGGAGGTGSSNSTHFAGGAGGAGNVAGGGGGGGGSSAGTAAGGNAGGAGTATAAGAAGTAVTGGGAGGAGGGPAASGSPPVAGPGGGGGARGATGTANGAGFDGQITLSGFTAHPSCSGSFSLAPLGLGATATAPAGTYSLAPLALAGTGNVCNFTTVQNGPISTATTGSNSPSIASASTAGTMLVAGITSSGTTSFTAPAGWVNVAGQNTGGGANAGRLEVWYYPNNPGGISSATFTGGGSDSLRACISEFSTPTGTTQILDVSAVNSNTGPTAALTVTTGAANTAGDLGLAYFESKFTSTESGSWTPVPTGWTQIHGQTGVGNWLSQYAQCGLTNATQTATGTVSNTTNQAGEAGILATFAMVGLVHGTGSYSLAPLAASGTGNAVVPAGTIVSNGSYALAPLAVQSPSTAITFPTTILPVMIEILVNGVWTDITDFVYTRDGINISGRGRPDEASTAQPAQVTLTLNNTTGAFSPGNVNGQWFPYLVRNTQLRISVVAAVTPTGANYTGYRFWGEVPGWPPQADPSQTDIYVSITAAGVLQRMRQSKKSLSPLARWYGNLYSILYTGQPPTQTSVPAFVPGYVPAGYWPCEDGTTSATFASGLPGGSPMTWSGTPGLASDSNVPGSAPMATLSGSAWTGTPGTFSQGGQTFSTPGTFQWQCPAGITSVKAECWGAGGGGSSGITGDGGGSGGGGGSYSASPAVAVTPGKTYTLVVGVGGTGGAGTFSGKAGTAGTASSFTGDTFTVLANPGGGGPASSGHGAGGSGGTGATQFAGGNGGNGQAGDGGSGGGSSGGNAANGNNGHTSSSTTGAAGGAAPVDGGPGGTGGTGQTSGGNTTATPGNIPVPGPGGGGGGGGYRASDKYGKPGGGGQNGQVTLSFGAATPAPPANVLRFVLDVPFGGGVDGATMAQALTNGTVADFHVLWHTGGNLQLVGKSGGGTTLFDSGSHAFGALGTSATVPSPLLVSAELTQTATSTITWKLTAVAPNATAVVATYTGTITGTLGSCTFVKTNSAAPADTGSTGVGHLSMQYAVDPILDLAPALGAYAGELAATRFIRLCGEQKVPVTLFGNASDTPQMGPQPVGQLVDLLQDCETADLGQMFETRSSFGMGYCTRVNMQNQAVAATLDYSQAQLAPPLAPTDDERLIANDIVVTRTNGTSTGSSYEVTQTSGTLSVQDPPNGVGYYTTSPDVNLYTDLQLTNYANWLLTLGTVDEFRYPQITIAMHRTAMNGSPFSAVANLDIPQFLQIINTPFWLPPGPINALCAGFSETISEGGAGAYLWTITINAIPEDPYTSGNSGSSSTGGLPTW